jgi:hypothetical protein
MQTLHIHVILSLLLALPLALSLTSHILPPVSLATHILPPVSQRIRGITMRAQSTAQHRALQEDPMATLTASMLQATAI